MKSKHHAGGVELALQRQDGSQKAAGPDRASVRGPRGARTFFQTALALLSVRVSQRQRDVTLTLCPSSSPMTVWQANLYRGLPFIAIVSWLITASEISDVRSEKSRSKSGGSSFPFAISLFLQGAWEDRHCPRVVGARRGAHPFPSTSFRYSSFSSKILRSSSCATFESNLRVGGERSNHLPANAREVAGPGPHGELRAVIERKLVRVLVHPDRLWLRAVVVHLACWQL